MPYFIVEGKAKASGRKIKPRRFMALHAEAAVAKAKKSGMIPEKVELLKVSHFVCEVAGASHDNPDGTSRQAIVKKCKRLETVILQHEVGNRYDKHALQIVRATGEQVGYIPKELADDIVDGYATNGPCICAAVSLGAVPLGDSPTLVTTSLLVVFAVTDTEPELISTYIQELGRDPEVSISAEHIPNLTTLECVDSRHQTAIDRSQRETRNSAKSSARARKAGCFGAILLLASTLYCGFLTTWFCIFR